ncbi:MAG: hypothetical protein AB2A00_18745 [Myxococcota bacterium]
MPGRRGSSVLKVLAACVVASLSGCTTTGLPFCQDSPEQQGQNIFQSARGERNGDVNLHLIFELITTRDERFTNTPEIITDLGSVQDAEVVGKRLDIFILLPSSGARTGKVKLRGTISAEFQAEVDRCPYERTFTVQVKEGSVDVN